MAKPAISNCIPVSQGTLVVEDLTVLPGTNLCILSKPRKVLAAAFWGLTMFRFGQKLYSYQQTKSHDSQASRLSYLVLGSQAGAEQARVPGI